MTAPRFVIVGNVNAGKSSIVSTLAADETVRIDAMPGTTRENRVFPMKVNDNTLYELIDTPGFEHPREVRQWLLEHETDTANRAAVIRDFIETFAESGQFDQECKLLRPIMDGGAILYIVDAKPAVTPNYEAEMQILQWTGQPRMALINRTDGNEYINAWKPVLDQYFRIVREFDSHHAMFEDRVRLIRALREIHEPWEPALNEAIAALVEERTAQGRETVSEIADLLVNALTRVDTKTIGPDEEVAPHEQKLIARYFNALRSMETAAHREIEDIYERTKLVITHDELSLIEQDLFNAEVWKCLGLTRTQLAAAGAVGGAVAGGAIDLAVGGASFLTGTLIGGATGAAAGYFTANQLPRMKVSAIRLPLGGRELQIGPMKNRNFPFILLDRALLHHQLIAQTPHARREAITAEQGDATKQGITSTLPADDRKKLERLFEGLRKRPSGEKKETLRAELSKVLGKLLTESSQFKS